MKKFMFAMAIVAFGSFAACNNAGSEASKDSTATKMADSSKMSADSSKMSADSSKMAMDSTKKDTSTKK